ncbi:MAG: fumarate hydratase [Spirochaetae bacterium HGW-Spirochaetae-5]|nr:MAG: fumarate hydratase [Spirochaetae bacterium HGW-Spirochaetae-5]
MERKTINTPLTDDIIENLHCGDLCFITGKLLTARDKAHERIAQMLSAGEKLPFDLKNEIIYYVGPTPAKPGEIIGAAGPTTSSRMDHFSPIMFELGIKAMIGKGRRDNLTKELTKKYRAVYFSSFGGAGAYLSKRIKSSKIIAFDDLASEAVHELFVENFPVVVAIDMYGEDIYEHAVHRGE